MGKTLAVKRKPKRTAKLDEVDVGLDLTRSRRAPWSIGVALSDTSKSSAATQSPNNT